MATPTEILVLKFGGTSVADQTRLANVAKIVAKTKAETKAQIVVVVSAMAGETDRLLNVAKSIFDEASDREIDALLATGEQASSAMLAMHLAKLGLAAKSLTGMQAKILTDTNHRRARILDIDCKPMRKHLAEGNIIVVAGFQGFNQHQDITTLGRGGSDITAVALAAALQASECRIYTDVDGIYTADPRMVPEARRLDKITFEEMLELASLGAKVLQIRSVEFAGKYKVKLRVLSTFSDGPGTLISYEEDEGSSMEQPVITGIAVNRNEAKFSLCGLDDKPGVVAKILQPLSAEGICVDMIAQTSVEPGTINLAFTVASDDYTKAYQLLMELTETIPMRQFTSEPKVAKLSLVGVAMRTHAGVASKMFTVLGESGIAIKLVASSEIKVSVILDEAQVELGARALHQAFGLSVSEDGTQNTEDRMQKEA